MTDLPSRWLGAARGTLRLMSVPWLVCGAGACLATAAVLGARAGDPDQAARAFRLAWLVWLAGLAGIGEDHGERRRLVVPTPRWERFLLRCVLGATLSTAVGVVALVLVRELAETAPGGGRLVAEAVVTFAVVAGWGGLMSEVAPPGRVGAATLILLLGSLTTELLFPLEWRVWPAASAQAYAGPPVAWGVGGALLLSAAFAATVVGDARGAR